MKTRYLFTAMLALTFASSSGQKSQVLYFMNLPQNHFLNPAIRPTNSLYLGLPVLAGVNLNISNNYFNFSDVFSNGLKVSESTVPFLSSDFDAAKFLSKIKDRNFLETEAEIQLLGLGFSAGKDLYFFIDVIEHFDGNIVLPRDLMNLAFTGNQEFIGKTFDLAETKTDIKYYHEIGLGLSKNVTGKLRLGIKGKLLYGIAAGSFKANSLDLTINSDLSNTMNSDVAVNISGPVQFYFDSQNNLDSAAFDENRFNSKKEAIKFLTNRKNAGFGLDVGAEYEVNDRFVLSASLTNFGFIKWKTDVSNLKLKNNIQLHGYDIADIYAGNATIEDLGKTMIDSLQNSILFDNKSPFKTVLPFGVTLAGRFNLTKKFSVGVLSYSKIADQHIREALTLSGNLNIGNLFSTTLTYTACNSTYDNLGAGIAIRGGFAQFYFLVDRIPLTWGKVDINNHKFPLPLNMQTVQTWVGMNLTFGNNVKKKRDRPMVTSD